MSTAGCDWIRGSATREPCRVRGRSSSAGIVPGVNDRAKTPSPLSPEPSESAAERRADASVVLASIVLAMVFVFTAVVLSIALLLATPQPPHGGLDFAIGIVVTVVVLGGIWVVVQRRAVRRRALRARAAATSAG